MTHVRTLTLDALSDPIHAAIERHRIAYDAYQVAPKGEASMVASDDYDAATDALAIMPCASRFGALALLAHLRWWLGEEAKFSAGHQPGYGIAEARIADLTLFLGTNLPPVSIPYTFPQGRMPPAPARLLPGVDRYSQSAALAPPNEALPGEIEPWQAVAAIRPDTAFVRARRVTDARRRAAGGPRNRRRRLRPDGPRLAALNPSCPSPWAGRLTGFLMEIPTCATC